MHSPAKAALTVFEVAPDPISACCGQEAVKQVHDERGIIVDLTQRENIPALAITMTVGRRANLMALIAVLPAGAASIVFVKTTGIKLGYSLGLFAGSGTSTPTLGAAMQDLCNGDHAVGYPVAYPVWRGRADRLHGSTTEETSAAAGSLPRGSNHPCG